MKNPSQIVSPSCKCKPINMFMFLNFVQEPLAHEWLMYASIDSSVMHQKNAKKIPAEGVASQNFRQKKGWHVSGCQVSQKFFSCRKPLLSVNNNDGFYGENTYSERRCRINDINIECFRIVAIVQIKVQNYREYPWVLSANLVLFGIHLQL